MRLLVANDPRAYRDVLAMIFARSCPHVELIVAEPDALDQAIIEHIPDLVICSSLTTIVRTHAPAWVVLYPAGARQVTISVIGNVTTLADIDLTSLLSIVDQTVVATRLKTTA